MIKDIISFELANKNFIIDFQKTPIILNAKDYITNKAALWDPELLKVIFDNEQVEIINITENLDRQPKEIYDSSRILVGEYDDKMFGFIVDRVVEIINLNGNNDFLRYSDDSNDKYLEISGEMFQLVNIERILEKKILKHKMD